jgi:hypothetical protein
MDATQLTEQMPESTQKERMLAGLIHISSIPAPIWGPAIGWLLVKNWSPFAKAHAVKAVRDELFLKLGLLVSGAISLTYTITKLIGYAQNDWQGFVWWEFVLRAGIGWLIVIILGVITTIVSIFEAKSAFSGAWPKSMIKKALRQQKRLEKAARRNSDL